MTNMTNTVNTSLFNWHYFQVRGSYIIGNAVASQCVIMHER